MDTLFPQPDSQSCRVCADPVVDGRWNYCSRRCRDIAKAVQRMFTWSAVREQVLERDDHTCQHCGLTKERSFIAHWNVHDDIRERAEAVREEHGWDAWRRFIDDEESRYGLPLYERFEVDHIQPISDGGHRFDEANLQTLCKPCHAAKTAAENSTQDEPRPEIPLDEYL